MAKSGQIGRWRLNPVSIRCSAAKNPRDSAKMLVSWSGNSSDRHLTRHCEERSDDAIQGKRRAMALDCFASLAMTWQMDHANFRIGTLVTLGRKTGAQRNRGKLVAASMVPP